jgi:hypothetical protein
LPLLYIETNETEEELVTIDLPAAYAGLREAVSVAPRSLRQEAPGVLAALVEGRTRIALEREWRLTMALVLRQLGPGRCLRLRDAVGREWYIGPAGPCVARLREEMA